ncbi:MAG: methyltransferase domain-containing protein [Nitriliruptorales bacterium]|nr:methyltransferase domain-containing protein [Nitriliruptorales bacterium]
MTSGSGSLEHPTYWWYVARARLLEAVLGPYVRQGARILDVGSADGPSVAWLGDRVAVDIDPRGLRVGSVCASAEALPFPDKTFDVVTAFDVVEHCEHERVALSEFRRVVKDGGAVLLSVPAYQWLWSGFDVRARHHRRYTRHRLRRAAAAVGLTEKRSTYAFGATLPFFVLSRLLVKAAAAPASVRPLPAIVERVLLALTRLDERLLRRRNLPAGSSVFYAGTR